MHIAVGSIFMNATGYIHRYAKQLAMLEAASPENIYEPILAEGDSTDNEQSWFMLKESFGECAFKCEHHGPNFGSVDHKQRWRQSSFVWEQVIRRVRPEHDAFIYIESDLIWEPPTMLKLLEHIKSDGVDVAVPMCWREGYFYDCWGMRGPDGVYFDHEPPYHRSLKGQSINGLYPIKSAGSCLVMRGEVPRNCTFEPADQAIVGLCQNIREYGYKIWIDPSLGVTHP
jgi:hypothetical protein